MLNGCLHLWQEAIRSSVFNQRAKHVSQDRTPHLTQHIGFLIGIVLSYLSSEQLKAVGANALIVNILGIGIIRELGPVITAVLVAGRSGSSITAMRSP